SRAMERSAPSWPDILGYVLENPLSRFAETLRAVKVAADINSIDQKVKVIGVVSSLPGEGKSTIAANFANLLSFTGRSVLLIDADLRNPTLSRQITPNRPAGLLELLTGDATVDQVIHVNP